ncbi:MAG: T9SS type A sorting domain-containing protein [Bacteroidia bacterium]
MKKKLLTSILKTIIFSVSLFAQRQPTTGHSITNDVGIESYVFGGQKSDGSLSNELWLTSDFQSFKLVTNLGPSARKNHDAWIFQGKLYIKGGVDALGNCIDDLWEFDLLTETWTKYTDHAPYCSFKKRIIKLGGNLYIAGGSDSSGASVSKFGSRNLMNISSGYTSKADMIEPLSGCGIFKKNGNIFLFGGYNHDWDAGTPGNQPSYSKNIWRYNVSSNFWDLAKAKKSGINELTDMAYTQDSLENFFYVFGGKTYNYDTKTEIYSDEIYKLDLNTFSWTKYSSKLPYGIAEFTATYKHGTSSNTDTIFLIGGKTASGLISNNVFKFLPSTGQIITVPLSTSINEYALNNDKISIYPNPANNILFIKNADKNSTVIIYDSNGKQLINSNLQNEQINISEIPNGFYIIIIKSDNYEIIKRFIKN